MDKRTVLFVITLSLTLFLVNLFFNYQNQQHRKEWVEAEQTRRDKLREQIASDVEARSLKPGNLPVIAAYSGEDQEEPSFRGLQFGDGIVILTDHPVTPDHLFFEKDGQRQQLTRKGFLESSRTLAFYLPPDGKKIPVTTFDALRSKDLHFLVPTKQADTPFLAILTEQDKGQVKWLLDIPKDDALVVTVDEDQIIPVALFSVAERRLVPLVEAASLTSAITVLKPDLPPTMVQQTARENYFVLENEYQQLVFSSRGGALVEINLPFKTEENKASIVRAIGIDRQVVEQSVQNAEFPLHPYTTASANGQRQEHDKGETGHYYPLLRRDILTPDGSVAIDIPARFYALNVVSEYPEVAELNYEVKTFTDSEIVFEAVQPHRRITKTYTLTPGDAGAPYILDLSIKIDGDSRSLWLTSGVPEVEWISASPAPAMKYRITRQDKPEVEKLSLPKTNTGMSSVYPDWLCNSNGFFGLIIDPLTEAGSGFQAEKVPGELVPSRLIMLDTQMQKYKSKDLPGYQFLLPLPPRGGETQLRVYAGPFAESTLKAVDAMFSDPSTGYKSDYIAAQSFHGWFSFISQPFAKFLFILMKSFHYATDSWTLSIILLTVALKIMMYPLNAWSLKSMRRVQALGPQTEAIKEKYKKDPQRASLEVMKFYKEKKANPFLGCLPLFIQMPFLIGMLDLLKSTFELRGAPFIPGWIDDLAAPDVLFTWNFHIPIIGNEFHLLPFLLGATMFLQQKMTTWMNNKKTAAKMSDEQRQQASMGTMMSALFTVMFYNFPSGLNIYWLFSSILQVGQTLITNKQVDKEFAEEPKPRVVSGKKWKGQRT